MTPMSSPGSGFSFKRKKCVTDYVESFLDMDTLHNWSLDDLTKAGKLLRKPPIQCKFLDEHEMRRVYSMIYDVFRCEYKNKFILDFSSLLPIFTINPITCRLLVNRLLKMSGKCSEIFRVCR